MPTNTLSHAVEPVRTALGRYWRSDAPREKLAAYLKSAGAGDGEGQGGFEQAFGSLAYSYLKDKSPRLLDKIVGFQMVDRNEDSTRAVGVFGIRFGKQWIFAPMFFLNGELKGHELLYLPRQGIFIPNDEGWVNYLLTKQPHESGEATDRDAYQLGGLAPDITRLSRLPFMGKSGADSWAYPFLPVCAAAAADRGRPLMAKAASGGPDLFAVLARSPGAAAALLGAAASYPAVKSAVDRLYGPDLFERVAGAYREKAAAALAPKFSPPPARFFPPSGAEKRAEAASRLRVFDDVALTKNAPGLSDEDRTKALRGGYLVDDKRDPSDVSELYDTTTTVSLSNPEGSGLYDVLEKPANFSRMLVLTSPTTSRGRESFSTVVRLSGGRAWLNSQRNGLWSREKKEHAEYRGWFAGLPDSKPEKGSCYVLVGEGGDGTAPFTVREDYGGGVYKVDFETHEAPDRSGPPLFSPARAWDGGAASPYDAVLRYGGRKGTKLRSLGGELIAPDGYKFLKVSSPSRYGSGSEEPPVQPGRLDDVQLFFTEKTAALSVVVDGPDYHVESALGRRRFDKRGALFHLLRDHGLSEKSAEAALDAPRPGSAARFRVKYAAPYPPLGSGSQAPPLPPPLVGVEFNGPNAVRAVYPQEEQLPVPALDSSLTDMSVYDPWRRYAYEQIKGPGGMGLAGEKDDKELFDVSALSQMTKSLKDDALGESDLPVYVKAIDKLGRRIFNLYWHSEDYDERYGKHDLPELEDALRNAFTNLGEVALFLKQKSVAPMFGENSEGEIDVDDSARN